MSLLWRLILLFSLLAAGLCFAHSEPVGDTDFILPLEPESPAQNWHLLADESGQLSLKEVQGERSLFRRLDSPDYASSGSQRAVWVRTQINAQGSPQWLWVSARHLEYLDVYLLRAGQLEWHIQSGEQREPAKGVPQVRPYLISLPNDGHARELYLRLQSNHPMTAYFQIADETVLAVLERTAHIHGALLGGMGLLVLYSLLRFVRTERWLYLWLGLLHASLLGGCMANLGLLAVWMPELAARQSLLADLSPLLASMALLAALMSQYGSQAGIAFRWVLRLGFYLLASAAFGLLLLPWFTQDLLIYSLAACTALACWMLALRQWIQGASNIRAVLGYTLIGFCFTGLLAFPLGYALLSTEGLISGLFAMAALGALLLTVEQKVSVPVLVESTASAFSPPSSSEREFREALLLRLNHELLNPLGNLLDTAELLLGTTLSAKQQQYAQSVQGAGQELLCLINEFLDVPRLMCRHIELDYLALDFPALITECFDVVERRASRRHISLHVRLDPQLPRVFTSDPVRLRQIILGLLDQAIRQSPPGALWLEAQLDATDPEQPKLYVRVLDRGPSLTPELRSALLAPNGNRHQVLEHLPVEVSLGLFTASELVRLMRGEFGVQQQRLQGNLLWFSLPIACRSHEPPILSVSPLQGARLLIVENEEVSRRALLSHCSEWGMEVDAVADAKEAMALLRTRAHLGDGFDAVLIAQALEGITGLQLALKIKEDASLYQDISLILIATPCEAPSQVDARNAGVCHVLSRPVSGYLLKTLLHEELERHPEQRRRCPVQPEPSLAIPEGFSVLIAEDDKASAKITQSMLKRLGVSSERVMNGEEALKAMQQHHYDLVLMDCEMPVLDGYAATRLLRDWESSHPEHLHTYIVALTAHVLSEHQILAAKAGMDEYVAKPVELSRLRALIDQQISIHRIQQEAKGFSRA